MPREQIIPQSEVIRAILLEDSPCCGVPHRAVERPQPFCRVGLARGGRDEGGGREGGERRASTADKVRASKTSSSFKVRASENEDGDHEDVDKFEKLKALKGKIRRFEDSKIRR